MGESAGRRGDDHRERRGGGGGREGGALEPIKGSHQKSLGRRNSDEMGLFPSPTTPSLFLPSRPFSGVSSPGSGWGWGWSPGWRQRGLCAPVRMPSPGGGPGLRHLCTHTPRTAPLRRLPGSDPRPPLSFSPLSGQITIMVVHP